MTVYSTHMERVARLHGLGPDYANVRTFGALPEDPDDFTDTRWQLEQLADDADGLRILRAYIIAENAAWEYIEARGPVPRPAPEWLDDDDNSLDRAIKTAFRKMLHDTNTED